MVVVCDQDSKVLARKTLCCRARDLESELRRATRRRGGLDRGDRSCEPTGHGWRVLCRFAADRSVPFVCVQPMVTSWAPGAEGLTFDKTDDKDAVLIACYIPEPVNETWGQLRHLGARRERLIVVASA